MRSSRWWYYACISWANRVHSDEDIAHYFSLLAGGSDVRPHRWRLYQETLIKEYLISLILRLHNGLSKYLVIGLGIPRSKASRRFAQRRWKFSCYAICCAALHCFAFYDLIELIAVLYSLHSSLDSSEIRYKFPILSNRIPC